MITLWAFTSNAQVDYLEYHSEINLAEELIGQEFFEAAIEIYDTTFAFYSYVYTKDYVIAAQVAMLAKEEDKAIRWLQKAMANGYPCACIEKLNVFKNGLTESAWIELKSKSTALIVEYDSKVDKKLQFEFHQNYKAEQESKSNKELYRKIVHANFKRIKYLMNSFYFPSERILGLDRDDIYPTIKGGQLKSCEAGNSKIIPTLLHQPNPIKNIGIDKFLKAIKQGHLHPNQFASIYTFEINRVSSLYQDKSIESTLPAYNFNFPFGKQSPDLARVNLDRNKFGICSIETAKAKRSVAKKYGLKLSFGYK